MLVTLLKLFVPTKSVRRSMPFVSVLLVLSVGIGIFWTVQCLFSNYYNGLIKKVTESKEEITIVKNPSSKFKTTESEEEAFFNDESDDDSVAGRLMVSPIEVDEVKSKLSSIQKLQIVPIIRYPDFEFVLKDNVDIRVNGLLIGFPSIEEDNVIPILDQISNSACVAFNSWKPGERIPIIISQTTFPDRKVGEDIVLRHGKKENVFVISEIIQQNGLFSFPMFIVPVEVAHNLTETSKFSAIAIRVLNSTSSFAIKTEIKGILGEKYIVSHWSESLAALRNLFKSINIIISTIVSSLFIISFFFSISAFDILIKQRQKHLALLLAIGMKPAMIRRGLLLIGLSVGVIGVLLGGLLSQVILLTIPHTPLHSVLKMMFLDDLHFSFSLKTTGMIVIMSLLVTIGSAWMASRRIFKLEPIEDLRK